MKKQTLFLFTGYPGSGKSTFAKQLSVKAGMPRINADELRRFMYKDDDTLRDPSNNPITFGALDYAMETLLKTGTDIIYDANTNRIEHRATKAKEAARYGARVVLIVMDTPLDVAKSREATRELPPRFFRVPEQRYNEIVASAEPPTEDELVITINGQEPFDKQYESFCAQLEALQ